MDVAGTAPRTLVMSRRRAIVMAVIGVALIVWGIVLEVRGVLAGRLVIALFSLSTIFIVIQVVWPARLVLDDDGFTYISRFPSGQVGRDWRSCGPFVATGSSVRVAGQDPGERPNPEAARRGTAIPAGFDGLNPRDLAALLNRYRDASMSRPWN